MCGGAIISDFIPPPRSRKIDHIFVIHVSSEIAGGLPGRVIPESVVYSFGTLLLDLLTGKYIPLSH
ncbi:hypothetical protein Taro_045800, partial [Colocasia esculenta]|nr:hypothetical protein [Colocasia esculenta]